MAIINIIDLFAGPGGLGEGFASFEAPNGKRPFKIRMSVEMEEFAHQTLTTRAVLRQVDRQNPPKPYLDLLDGKIAFDDLKNALPKQWAVASEETMHGPKELGPDNSTVFSRIDELKREYRDNWIVIGGPPCQAYSLAGRSRNKGIAGYKAEDDNRHFLYREYLEVLATVKPIAFVMENVKGILSARVNGSQIFPQILEDLRAPSLVSTRNRSTSGTRYTIQSFVVPYRSDLAGGSELSPVDYLIRSEEFGVPQARHRVILLGIREDISFDPEPLEPTPPVSVWEAIGDLPPVRSTLSKSQDSESNWRHAIQGLIREKLSDVNDTLGIEFATLLSSYSHSLRKALQSSATEYSGAQHPTGKLGAFYGSTPGGRLLNHDSRGHKVDDLGRYFFSACFAQQYGRSPKAPDFPESLGADHKNWNSGHFADRFRVQLKGSPSSTVTSHISKDGHYYIHPDPTQCRSLTVREAARLQTFPDDYFFMGRRTRQYEQVGNAVPPLLARQLAEIIFKLA